jgi:hypothetical protein
MNWTTEKELELQALLCERESYISENKQREQCGQSMAYVSESFFELARRIRALAEDTPANIRQQTQPAICTDGGGCRYWQMLKGVAYCRSKESCQYKRQAC